MSCGRGPRSEPDGEGVLRLRARAPGHQSSISPLVRSLMEALKPSACAAEREFEIETVLREALANAAVHGCGNDPSKVVECEVSCDESGELAIVVRDPGPGFDPASVPNPRSMENVLSTHGRGIYLITVLMDDVWFERGGTEIHMVLRPARTPSRASAGPARRPSHLFSW